MSAMERLEEIEKYVSSMERRYALLNEVSKVDVGDFRFLLTAVQKWRSIAVETALGEIQFQSSVLNSAPNAIDKRFEQAMQEKP